MARLAISADEAGVARLEVDDLEPGTVVREAGRGTLDGRGRVTAPDVEHERRPTVSVRVCAPQGEKVVEQGRRKVVDARVAQVLEQLARLALSRARETADDEKMLDGGVRLPDAQADAGFGTKRTPKTTRNLGSPTPREIPRPPPRSMVQSGCG